MRTTVRLNDALLRGAKKYAVEHDTTLTELLAQGLRLILRENSEAYRFRPARKVFKLTHLNHGKLRPGIDPNSNSSLLDAADGLDVPR